MFYSFPDNYTWSSAVNDRQVPVEDARKAFAAAGSADKQLRVFTAAQGGAEHCQTDEPDPAQQLICDWFAQRLGTAAGAR